jgi:hypothetical protein
VSVENLRAIVLLGLGAFWLALGPMFTLHVIATGDARWISGAVALPMLVLGAPSFLWAVWPCVDHPPTALTLAALFSGPYALSVASTFLA